MTLPVAWLREPADDYYQARRWYTDINPHLAQRFTQAVEDAVLALAESPLRYGLIHKDQRRAWSSAFSL